jgi:hypothetical protein
MGCFNKIGLINKPYKITGIQWFAGGQLFPKGGLICKIQAIDIA